MLDSFERAWSINMEKYFSLPRANIEYYVQKKRPYPSSFILSIHHIHHKKYSVWNANIDWPIPKWNIHQNFLYIKFLLFWEMWSLISIIWKEKERLKIVKNIFYINIYIFWPIFIRRLNNFQQIFPKWMWFSSCFDLFCGVIIIDIFKIVQIFFMNSAKSASSVKFSKFGFKK